jgi:hypothetical protein
MIGGVKRRHGNLPQRHAAYHALLVHTPGTMLTQRWLCTRTRCWSCQRQGYKHQTEQRCGMPSRKLRTHNQAVLPDECDGQTRAPALQHVVHIV